MSKRNKRCKALSPSLHWRCEFPSKKHSPTYHKAAFTQWGLEEGAQLPGGRFNVPVIDEPEQCGPHKIIQTTTVNVEALTDRPKRERITSLLQMDEAPSSSQMSVEETELRGWWFDKAEAEINATVPKAIEYGSTDLIDIGHDLSRVIGRVVDDETAAEMGVYFYMLGKMSRWRSAMERGERVSDDTLLDIGIYVRMAQRIRYAGGWPGRAMVTPEHTIKQQTYGMEPQ